MLDVGTGGGVPGVVLAIVRPDLRISLTDSVGKKARVVADIVAQLGLSAPVLHARAEDILSQEPFDALLVRAVARLKSCWGGSGHIGRPSSGSWCSKARRGSKSGARPGITACSTICHYES